MRLLICLSLLALVTACVSGESELSVPPAEGARVATAGTATLPRVAHLDTDRIVARDGAALPLRVWLPEAAPRAVVLALHGFNDYSNGFADPAAVLAEHGVATYAYDQRGFGRAPARGRWVGTERMVDDAVTAMTLLRSRYPGVPLYVMGESMGAAVAILAATHGGAEAAAADGYILLAPAVWGRMTMNLFERAGLWVADLFPTVEWSPRALPITVRPSDNTAMLRELAADPLVIKTARSDALNGLVDLMGAALAAAPRFKVNAFILYGEQDAVVPRPPVARFVAELPPSATERQRFALYPAGFHLLLRDLEGPLVTADVLAWIENSSAPLPSGADRDARDRLAGRRPPASEAQRRAAVEPAS